MPDTATHDQTAQVVVDATLIARIQEQQRLLESLWQERATLNPRHIGSLLQFLRLHQIRLVYAGPGRVEENEGLIEGLGGPMVHELLGHIYPLEDIRMPGVLRGLVRKALANA